jgi:endonuclease YncB( thermonuclease family)
MPHSTGVRALLLTAGLSLVLSSVALGGAVWYRRSAGNPLEVPVTVAKAGTPAGQRGAPLPLLDPQPSPGAALLAPEGKIVLRPPYTAINGVTLRSGKQTIRLADLDAPPHDAICHDSQGGLWACGLRARVALNNLITGHVLECNAVRRDGNVILAHCVRDAADLGRELVRIGWARPHLQNHTTYSSELQAAREARVGLWETGWQLRAQRPRFESGQDKFEHLRPPD